VLIAALVCHQAFSMSEPQIVVAGARGCAVGLLICSGIAYALAIANSHGDAKD